MNSPKHTFESVVKELVQGLEDGSVVLPVEPEEEPTSGDLLHDLRLRRWARENYVPPDERLNTWSPIVLAEMKKLDVQRVVSPE